MELYTEKLTSQMWNLVNASPVLKAFFEQGPDDLFIYGGLLRDLCGMLGEVGVTWNALAERISDIDISSHRHISLQLVKKVFGGHVREHKSRTEVSYVVDAELVEGCPKVRIEIHSCHQFYNLDFACNTLAYQHGPSCGWLFSTQEFLPLQGSFEVPEIIRQCRGRELMPHVQYLDAAHSRFMKMSKKGFALARVHPGGVAKNQVPDFVNGVIAFRCDLYSSAYIAKLSGTPRS